MLIAKNIYKSFADTAVLKDVDITIEPGKLTALIGPSGSGKTTLLRALSLIDHPDKGTITLDGVDYSFPRTLDEDGEPEPITPPWPNVTVVFQQLFLWPHLTLRDNILLPLRHKKEDQTPQLNELIDLFQMGHFIDKYPNETSGGQKQRAALVRAIMLNPRYLLLDEITSALDVRQVSRILTHLPKLKDRGMGMLLITHSLNFARHAADQVVFMDEGQVIEAGSTTVITKPKEKATKEFMALVEAAS